MKLIALMELTYAGKSLKAGDEFHAQTSGDAKVLIGAGRARDAAESPAEVPARKPKRRSRYNRTDMRSED